ncbi:MAG: outer membrane beta-barrel protein [Saprospiraceae bacterium]|nr:outer membrane beta-barrel protein [Saprospiraceae bacterium]
MVHISHRFLIIAVMAFCGYSANAQYLEGGIIGGGTVYEGDLSPRSFMDKWSHIKPAVGVFVRQNFNQYFAVRLSYEYGTFAAADGPERANRNLSFQSTLSELAATVEFNFPGYDPALYKRLSPYAFVGIAYMHFSPKADVQGQLVELQPLGTEGQGLDGYGDFYSLDQLTIPFGGGIKYALTPTITIAAEFGPRMTFTDYLDDVSGSYASYRDLAQNRGTFVAKLADRANELTGAEPIDRGGEPRGNPKFKDWYFFGNITISYHFYDLIGQGSSCPTF